MCKAPSICAGGVCKVHTGLACKAAAVLQRTAGPLQKGTSRSGMKLPSGPVPAYKQSPFLSDQKCGGVWQRTGAA